MALVLLLAPRAAFDEPRLARLMAGLLAPRGRLLVITGSATEAAGRGPSVLTRDELARPFEEAGLRLLSIWETRFDPTPSYGERPPMAWCAVFEK